MDFSGSALAEVDHAGPRRRAAHDGVIDNDHAFAADRVADEVEFHPHVEVADHLRGLQESAADVMVAHESVGQRNAARLGITLRRVVARVGHRHDDVRRDGTGSRETAPHLDAHLGHVAAAQVAVGPREIDELENAEGRRGRSERAQRADTIGIDDDNLAGFDLAHELRADEIEGARFGRQHMRLAEAPEHERTESTRIAHADQRFGCEHDEAEGTLERAERGGRFAGGRLTREKVQDDFAVGGGLENGTGIFQFRPQSHGIDDVSIVRYGQRAPQGIGHERLRVGQGA